MQKLDLIAFQKGHAVNYFLLRWVDELTAHLVITGAHRFQPRYYRHPPCNMSSKSQFYGVHMA